MNTVRLDSFQTQTVSTATLLVALIAMPPSIAGAANVTNVPAVTDSWLSSAWLRVDELAKLRSDWNGRGGLAPNVAAVELAKQLLLRMNEQLALRPERLVPVPDGGIATYFVGGRVIEGGASQRYARLTCDNDGEIWLLQHDRATGQSEVAAIAADENAIDEALDQIQAFLG